MLDMSVNPKKIAVLVCSTPSIFWFRIDMMKRFVELGYEVVAIGNEPESKWAEQFSNLNIRYICAYINRNGMNPLDEFKTYLSIKKILKIERPGYVFTNQAKMVVYGGIAAHRLHIDEVYPLIGGLGSIFLHDTFKYRVVRQILLTEYKISFKHAKNVFIENIDDIEYLVSKNIVDRNKVVLINGSGVNLDKFCLQRLPNSVVFICVSRLIRDKGVIEYLDAARLTKKKYSDIRFLLVGPMDSNPSSISKSELQEYIDDGTVEYFGEQKDVRPYLAMASVFVLPSYREGTPVAVLEAMACGKAIITTDAPGCRETVIDGRNGYLVPVRNVDYLSERMINLIEAPSQIDAMAKEGRNMVEQRFNVDSVNQVICTTMGLKSLRNL